MTDRTEHRPRHLYDTGKFATLPPHMQVRPKKYTNEPKTGSPHVAADGSKVHTWPVQDSDPTRVVQPRPHTPPPPTSPPDVADGALPWPKRLLWSALLVAALGVVAIIAGTVAGVS